MINTRLLNGVQATTKNSVVRTVKTAKRGVQATAAASALSAACTVLNIASNQSIGAAFMGGCTGHWLTKLKSEIDCLKLTKQVLTSERGVSYKDIVERAKQIYNK